MTECLAPYDPCECTDCQEAAREYFLNNADYHSMEAELKKYWDCVSYFVHFSDKKGKFEAQYVVDTDDYFSKSVYGYGDSTAEAMLDAWRNANPMETAKPNV